MTINDIILRDIMEEEKKERAREEQREARKTRRGEAIVRWACIAGGVLAGGGLAVATILFLAWCIISDTPHRRGIFDGNESRTERECAPAN